MLYLGKAQLRKSTGLFKNFQPFKIRFFESLNSLSRFVA